MTERRFPPPWSVWILLQPLSERQRNVWDGCRDFFFLPSLIGQKNFDKKTFPPRVILPGRGEADDSHSIAGAGRHRSDHGDNI